MYSTSPSPQDYKRIGELSDLMTVFTEAAKAYFHATGRVQELVKNAKPEERKLQSQYLGQILNAFKRRDGEHDAAFYNLKVKEVFARAAARTESMDTLASLMPVDKLNEKDVVLFKRYEMNTLATIIQTALQYKNG